MKKLFKISFLVSLVFLLFVPLAKALDVNTKKVSTIRARSNGQYWIRFKGWHCGGGGSEPYLLIPSNHKNKEGIVRLATAAILSNRPVRFAKSGNLGGSARCKIKWLELK